MEYRIREAAEIAGVSVRTLHHYDAVGLLCPEKSDGNGYRLYTDDDLQKLQQIMFFRELEFSLAEISKILESPGFDKKKALGRQLSLLEKKKERLENIIKSVRKTIRSMEEGKRMNNNEIFGPFDMKEIEEHKRKYASEAGEKYGNTEAWAESSRRTSGYTSEDWKRIHIEHEAIKNALAEIMDGPDDSEAAMRLVGEWKDHISRNYYECSNEILAGLGEMYVSDSRFTENIDKTRPGLADFLSRAIRNYCKNN